MINAVLRHNQLVLIELSSLVCSFGGDSSRLQVCKRPSCPPPTHNRGDDATVTHLWRLTPKYRRRGTLSAVEPDGLSSSGESAISQCLSTTFRPT